MNIESVLIATVVATGVTVAGPFAATAGAGGLAPHEKTTAVPDGMSVTVGHTDSWFHPVAPLNGMPTNREVYLTNTSYGRVEGGTGTIHTGWLVGCAVDLDVTFDIDASVGVDADLGIGISANPLTGVTPHASAGITPRIGGGMGLHLSITPGEIVTVERGSKDLPPGSTGYVVDRDYRLTVQNCGGPLTVQSYTIVEATSPEADAADWVTGDPIVL
ncbi:MspA family porin [Nocardia otitidiscaviarum]|uniref:MspA family porin n=1 Tax=Nocardia otitidiscaviarum TaxID=1823 RepID=UPI0004A6F9F3|nr:MspA family porin [Nocardia otitidiscaviarum]MBF6133708.1 MspA family porin [Nocardia otitidiscaviarum]MBF6487736.1 MspA family porin [Nocardia otitidiscaviarum]